MPAGQRRATADDSDDDESDDEGQTANKKKQGNASPSAVTLSGLLNAIDGVSSQEGCVLFATT